MSRFLALACLFLAVGCSSSRPDSAPGARGDVDSGPSLEARVDSLAARLELNDEQRESVAETLTERATALRTARALPTRRERRIAMERAQVEADSRIAATLTRAQRETYDVIRAERAETADPLVERQLARLREPLALTSEQEAAIAALLNEQADEIETLVDVYLRRGGQDVSDVRDEIRAIRESYDARIKAELTAVQIEALERLRRDEQRPGQRRRR